MSKGKKYYIVVWVLLVALFNFICFITPPEIGGISKFTSTFWTAYGFITVTFLIHLIFTLSMKPDDQEMRVSNASITIISWLELAIMVAAGSIAMIVPGIPYWVGSIVCAVILIFSIIFVVSAKIVGENTVKANIELNIRTETMRMMTDEAENLLKKAKNDEDKNIAKAVFEAFRYSDPTSNIALQEDEDEIQDKLNSFTKCISDQKDTAEVKKTADELIDLIEARNRKCKSLKRRV